MKRLIRLPRQGRSHHLMKRLRSAAAVLFLPLHQRTIISQLGCVTTETKFKGDTPGSTIYSELETKPHFNVLGR